MERPIRNGRYVTVRRVTKGSLTCDDCSPCRVSNRGRWQRQLGPFAGLSLWSTAVTGPVAVGRVGLSVKYPHDASSPARSRWSLGTHAFTVVEPPGTAQARSGVAVRSRCLALCEHQFTRSTVAPGQLVEPRDATWRREAVTAGLSHHCGNTAAVL